MAVRVRGAGRKQEVVERGILCDRVAEQNRSRTLQVGFE